jgi:hypothetical protein
MSLVTTEKDQLDVEKIQSDIFAKMKAEFKSKYHEQKEKYLASVHSKVAEQRDSYEKEIERLNSQVDELTKVINLKPKQKKVHFNFEEEIEMKEQLEVKLSSSE